MNDGEVASGNLLLLDECDTRLTLPAMHTEDCRGRGQQESPSAPARDTSPCPGPPGLTLRASAPPSQ